MRAFITGATGFVGGRLAERLAQRGDRLVCLVRSPAGAGRLRELGAELVAGDLRDAEAIGAGADGCDAVFHVAADYRVGLRPEKHPAMREANVEGTSRVLDAAGSARVRRIVHVSTIAAFGNTRGSVVDESYEHPGRSFTSEYERTKWQAHVIAVERATAGLPVVIVQPGTIYGPGDRSAVGSQLERAARGRLPFVAYPGLGISLVHLDDVVDGLLRAHDAGRPGRSYVLGGEITTLGEAIRTAAAVGGQRPPRLTVPAWAVRAMVPLAPLATRALKLPPNLREVISSADGVTFWASDARARAELGYDPRDLRTGLRQTFATAT